MAGLGPGYIGKGHGVRPTACVALVLTTDLAVGGLMLHVVCIASLKGICLVSGVAVVCCVSGGGALYPLGSLLAQETTAAAASTSDLRARRRLNLLVS